MTDAADGGTCAWSSTTCARANRQARAAGCSRACSGCPRPVAGATDRRGEGLREHHRRRALRAGTRAARAPGMEIFWFIPTHGDGRFLGPTRGARPVTQAYVAQIARAADDLGYAGVLLPT